eukprot:m.182114 g.182114  ORF g.182114 m.182114 type:complete len:430 (+) comp39286_c0_seq1:23-1312(+)
MDVFWSFFFLMAIGSTKLSARQLELVSFVFRHGDRSPVSTFPTDKHQVDAWPQGWGQLTQVGMLQHYELGEQLLKPRYMTKGKETYLLSSFYEREEIYIRSTDVDRTLMSAECQMASLYQPMERQVFLEGLNWQPTPIHTVPTSQDSLLRAYDVDCPRYQQLRKEQVNDPDYKKIVEKYQDLFVRTKKNTGIDFDLNPDNIYKIADPLFCEKQHNKSLPDWLTESDFQDLLTLNSYGIFKMFDGEEIRRLTSGLFIGEVLHNMELKVNGQLNGSKVFVYSAHDTTVAAILSGLGLFTGTSVQPPYASLVMIELYLEDSGSYTVEVYYHKGPDANAPSELQILPGCTPPCTIEKFKEFATPLIPEDFEKECQLSSGHQIGLIASLSLVGVSLLLVVIGFFAWKRKHRRHGNRVLLKGFASDDEDAAESDS